MHPNRLGCRIDLHIGANGNKTTIIIDAAGKAPSITRSLRKRRVQAQCAHACQAMLQARMLIPHLSKLKVNGLYALLNGQFIHCRFDGKNRGRGIQRAPNPEIDRQINVFKFNPLMRRLIG